MLQPDECWMKAMFIHPWLSVANSAKDFSRENPGNLMSWGYRIEVGTRTER